ncbi:MAG: type II secretion system protein [Chloroflexi bacterium]|nr:type II secretion system protein [Chloroflexota bacterium]
MKRIVTRVGRKQSGFTLVELLVVVGIIVALAAVVVPNVIQFAQKGDEGASAAEVATVQTAIDTYMADASPPLIALLPINVPVSGTGPAIQVFDGVVTGSVDLSLYMRPDLTGTVQTTNWYCWNSTGLVTAQLLTAGSCP